MKNLKITFSFFVFFIFFLFGFVHPTTNLETSCIQPKTGTADFSSVSKNLCESLFVKEPESKYKLFSNIGLQKFFGDKGRVMIYDYKPALPGRPTMLFIHGLGDDLFSMQKMAELAESDGYGILRVDLYGHGETLKEYLLTHDNKLPTEFDYQDNVDDIQKMILHLNIVDLSIVGHSYGGGIALRLAQILPKHQLRSVHALAPYIERIDKYISESFRSPSSLMKATAQGMKKAMVPKQIVASIMDPLFHFVRNLTSGFRTFQDLSNFYFRTDQTKDAWMDPVMDVYMYQTYRKYFLNSLDKPESSLSANELAFLDLRVKAAIIVTKGIRTLDYLDLSTPLEPFSNKMQIIGGQNDPLITPQQLDDFCSRLKSYKYLYHFTEIEGPNAGHLFPQTMPEQTYRAIQAYLTKP